MRWIRRRHIGNHRGVLLISTCLALSMFLLYSSAMALRTNAQQLVAARFSDRLEALDLAHGALEQFRDDFYTQFNGLVVATGTGDVMPALDWIDQISADPSTLDLNIVRDLPGVVSGAGTLNAPRRITLPTGTASAWVVSAARAIDPVTGLPDASPLATRILTVDAQATAGSMTKRLRTTYNIALGMSDIFRYAYFINNYGWFDAQSGSSITVQGEVRANGNFDFTSSSILGGEASNIRLNGDIYAAGNISGNPSQATSWTNYYLANYNSAEGGYARPNTQLVIPTQPAIGGSPRVLPYGEGWKGGEQDKYAQQPKKDMPYLGNLNLYRALASGYNGGGGSTITYNADLNRDGNYLNDGAAGRKTLVGEYNPARGPDGVAGTRDDGEPLVLIGDAARPIVIDGPVVVPGDVLVRGVVGGRGTIYAERNIHFVGSVTYQKAPLYVGLERDTTTGRLRQLNTIHGPASTWGRSAATGPM